MKNKKTIITFSILLALVSLFQLSFTWKARSFESKAKSFATKVSKSDKSNYSIFYRRYIDSLGNKPIYNIGIANYTYFECKQKEINLGLDLRGGMNVILEVDKAAIIRGLSNDTKDPSLLKAIEVANASVRDKGGDYVDYFVKELKRLNPNRRLANLFSRSNNKGEINSGSSDNEVATLLKQETESAIDRVYDVVEKRINQSNVTQPTIQKIDGGRISVELPGVDNPRRMEDLVEKSANLEFFEVYGNSPKAIEATTILEKLYKASSMIYVPTDSIKPDSNKNVAAAGLVKPDSNKVDSNKAEESTVAMNSSPLAKILKRWGNQQGPAIATVKASDRERLLTMLQAPQFTQVLEPNIRVAFDAKPIETNAQGKLINNADDYLVYFLKLDRDGKASLNSEEENIIKDARANTGQNGQIEVSMEMSSVAAGQWAQITGANIGKYIAIVLDNRVYSAPSVNQKISGGNSQISGSFDVKEAEDLANVLKAGKLPAPAKIVASEVVGPSLGNEAINAGLMSLLVGFLAIIAIMVLYYNRAGWIGIIAVLANVFLIMGVLASKGAALTLPGIAGIILTVGMAVDANVLIYERIKEELHKGKSLKNAVNDGYRAALSAIIDSNITMLLAAVILTLAGSGPAYGFAIILVIGIFCSLFTSLLVARLMIDYRVSRGKDLNFGFKWNANFLKNTKIDFVGRRKYFYFLTTPILIAGIAAFIYKGGISTGIDFKGGNAFIVQFEPSKNYSTTDIKETMEAAFPGQSNEVKTFGSAGQYRIVTTYMLSSDNKEDREKAALDVVKALGAKFQLAKKKMPDGTEEGPILSTSKVGAAIATATRNKSTFLVLLSIFGMFVYIIFRFRSVSYGLGATIALFHDVAVVLAVFALLDGWVPFPTEFDQHFIAALLTLIGYSMNDTVIIFDRIREFLNEHKSADRTEKGLINLAINDTLSRTIITASTVFVVLLVLFLFGGDALKSFSLAMLIGVIVGTYSSICIATPVVVDLQFNKDKKKK